jgi:hypothetical protein
VGDPREGVIVLPVPELADRYDKLPPPARTRTGLTGDDARRGARRQREGQLVAAHAAQVGVLEVDVDRLAALRPRLARPLRGQLGPQVAELRPATRGGGAIARAPVSSSRVSSKGSTRTCESEPMASRTPASR